MPSSTGKKDAARSLYSQGLSQVAIAKRLGIGKTTITDYKKQDQGAERDWDKLRADLKGKTPPPKPNLVSFERPRGDKAKASAATGEVSEYRDLSTMAGQLKLIDDLIAIMMREAEHPDSPQTYASSVGNIPRLLAERRAIRPMDKRELVLELSKMYLQPSELFQDLMTMGFGENVA